MNGNKPSMKTLKFKTNINCGNCLSKVSPILNAESGIAEWNVDLQDPEKTLTVKTVDLNPDDIKKTVLKSGFLANPK